MSNEGLLTSGAHQATSLTIRRLVRATRAIVAKAVNAVPSKDNKRDTLKRCRMLPPLARRRQLHRRSSPATIDTYWPGAQYAVPDRVSTSPASGVE